MKTIEISFTSDVPGVPAEVQVIPFGTHDTEKGTFVLDREGAEEILSDFVARANDMVIDYEHQTLGGGEAPAAGWIKLLVNKGSEGIWAMVEWTDRAREYLKNREYRYISPVFLKRVSDNRVVRLINAALTNLPAIDGMEPVVNKQSASHPSNGGIDGDGAKSQKEVRMKKLMDALGLGEDATEDGLVKVAASMRAEASEVREMLGLAPGATRSEVSGTIEALRQGHSHAGSLAARVAELEADISKRDAVDLVALAMKEGRVTPAQKDWALSYAERDPEGFRAFAAKAPTVVPSGEAVPGLHKVRNITDGIQARVNRLLGVSGESYAKFGRRED